MEQSSTRKWSILLVLSLALAIIILDTTLLNVSIAPIIKDLNTDIQGIQWVISAYSLTLAALTITGGRLGDLFGRKKMFMAGAIIFAIGSFITSISHSLSMMIIGEAIIEGIGAALMMPATSSLLVSNFKGRDRAIGFGVWGAVASASSALGPIAGGYLATNYSWRWGFRINILVAILLLLGSMIINEARDTEEKSTIDWLGVLLSSTGLLSFMFGIIESSTYGWWLAKKVFTLGGVTINLGQYSIVPAALAVGIVLLILFVLWEQRMDRLGKTPLVSMKLFSNKQFTTGALVTGILSLGMAGLVFSIPVFLQAVRGYDALHTGYSLLPMSLTLLIAAPFGASLTGKVRPKYLIVAGMILNVIATFLIRQAMSVDATAWTFAVPLGVFGIGMGLVMSQLNNYTLSAVSTQEAGEASGVMNTFRQIGSSFGSAVIGAVLLTALATNLSTGIEQSAVIPDQAKAPIQAAVAEHSSSIEFSGGQQAVGANLPKVLVDEVIRITHVSIVDANKSALIYGILFSVLGFLASFALPNKKNVEQGQSVASGH